MRRFGLFLAWLGIILVILFVLSLKSQTPNYNLLIYGLAGILLGTILGKRKKLKSSLPGGKNHKNNQQNNPNVSDDLSQSQEISSKKEKTTRRKHF